MFSMSKVAIFPKRTFPRHEMLAETDFVKLIWFGSGSFLDLASVLGGGLHLTESEGEVCH
jgi:hypothetical protein